MDLGLAAYVFTRSLDIVTNVADGLEAGWIGINNFSPALAEAPFGLEQGSALEINGERLSGFAINGDY